jgi:hypothetical protein
VADPISDLGAGLNAARGVVIAAVEAAELDGFIAGAFLERYEGESATSPIRNAATVLATDYEFTRSNVARIGLALACGWIPSAPAALARFVEGCDRLERQRPDQALDYRASIKLLWGVALGAAHPPIRGQRPDLAQRSVAALQNLIAPAAGLRDAVLATALVAELQSEARDERARALARRLLSATISDGDVVGALWASGHGCFGGPEAIADTRDELRRLEATLLPRALRAQPSDVLDALMADDLLGDLARDLAARISARQDALERVLDILDLFPEIARRIRERRHNRPAFVIENEYDVQDLLAVALKPQLPDLTDEEWTAKDAGGAKRIDLVSVANRICVEAKKPRTPEHARQIADELRIDIESYYVHPACDTLVIFVYDPTALMADAHRVEGDLSGLRIIKGRRVEVIARIRPR